MHLFHHDEHICDQCGQKFGNNDDLIEHSRSVHHHPIVRCNNCGMEFIHEKDRLHHVREEHEIKADHRTHKWEHPHDKKTTQEQVDESTHNFGDNF